MPPDPPPPTFSAPEPESEPVTVDEHPLPDDFLPAWQADALRRLAIEKARRACDAVRLYEALPSQQGFHVSMAPERILRGSNRGGKTLPAALEVARAVTGQDPLGRYPKSDGRCYAVGKDLTHCGQVMWRKLSRAGAFKIIRDKSTGLWRAYRPWIPDDLARAREAKPAPPLIPPRLIKDIGWESKKEGIPRIVRLKNGWEINFFSSLGEPPQGSDLDLVWFDEEIEHADWYPEMSARLMDRAGRFIWSATPQAGTEQLYELHERAEADAVDRSRPALVEEFVILLDHNPHISGEQKRQLRQKLSEEEARVRIDGEFAITSYRVFPEWDRVTHGTAWREIPRTWTRYAAVDPGRQICAVLFVAVPPPDEGEFVYAYDELYIPNCNAQLFGKRMADRCKDQQFEAFVIDHHEGRKTETGSGLTVEYQYSAALRENRIRSQTTGHGFLWGSDDVASGLEKMRSWLLVRDDGTPRLRAVVERLPNFDWEVRHYRFKKVGDHLTDKPEDRGRVHLMACWRYLAMMQPRYVRPAAGKAPLSAAVRALQAKRARAKARDGENHGAIRLGPGS